MRKEGRKRGVRGRGGEGTIYRMGKGGCNARGRGYVSMGEGQEGGVGVVQHSEANHAQLTHLCRLPVPTSEVKQLFLSAISGEDAERVTHPSEAPVDGEHTTVHEVKEGFGAVVRWLLIELQLPLVGVQHKVHGLPLANEFPSLLGQELGLHEASSPSITSLCDSGSWHVWYRQRNRLRLLKVAHTSRGGWEWALGDGGKGNGGKGGEGGREGRGGRTSNIK